MKPLAGLPNLTQYERKGLNQEFNLADGHAHQSPDVAQQEITGSLARLYVESERIRQEDAEADFRRTFYELAGQHSALRHPRAMLCYSASLATDIVAAYLRQNGMSTGLIHPCFDNLAAILRRREVPLVPVPEEALTGDHSWLDRPGGPDALFITLPNNPTGFTVSPTRFERLAEHCAATGTVLIVDWTFRFFDDGNLWDQYAVLERTGVQYICVEDTGKTWPTLDLKCSMLAASRDLHRSLAEVHNDMLLNVSPFILRLLVAYLDDTRRRGLDATVRRVVRANRRILRDALAGSVLVPADTQATISVEWIRIASDAMRSLDIVAMLAESGIGVLPGDHFHWHTPDAGAGYIRVALARDTAMFMAACRRLGSLITGLPHLREAGVR